MKWPAILFFAALFAAGAFLSSRASEADNVPRMTKEQLLPLIGHANVMVFDTRIAREWEDSGRKIKGAVRLDQANMKSMMEKLPKDDTLVFYCD